MLVPSERADVRPTLARGWNCWINVDPTFHVYWAVGGGSVKLMDYSYYYHHQHYYGIGITSIVTVLLQYYHYYYGIIEKTSRINHHNILQTG